MPAAPKPGSLTELRRFFRDPPPPRVGKKKPLKEHATYKLKVHGINSRRPEKAPPPVFEKCPKCDGHGRLPTGDSMRDIRLARRLSYTKLAERMGCSAPFVWQLERGSRKWTWELYRLYLKATRGQSKRRPKHRGIPLELMRD